MNITIDLTAISNAIAARKIALGNICLALLGATLVSVIYSVLAKVGATIASLLPYLAGGLLFLTLVGTFYFLLALLKDMRRSPRLRVSFWDCYTAVAVFAVMGFMSTACLNAFMASGNTLLLWNKASTAAALFTIFYGVARGTVYLFNDGDKKAR